jgi:hypothetical protein
MAQSSLVLLETDQSAETIVVEPNLCLMTNRVVGSGQREGSYEGLNMELLLAVRYTTNLETEQWMLVYRTDAEKAKRNFFFYD